MNTSFGPWTTAADTGSVANLSTFWKRRLAMIPVTYRSSARLGGRVVVILLTAAVLVWALPTLRSAAAQAERKKPMSENQTRTEGPPAKEPAGDAKLREQWEKLDDKQAAQLTMQHIQAIGFATHIYLDRHYLDPHDGWFPPAAVPNPNLPPEKRLSGLVLLLPYLGVKPNYIRPGNPWALEPFDADVYRAARELAKKIDLTKAWDDPANLEAARTVVPIFLVPGGGPFRDANGYAVSHFAFVRGAKGEDNGIFPKDKAVKISEIIDGTSHTMAVGQVHDELEPWIAAGPFPSRFVYHPSDKPNQPTFGSQFGDAAYFAFGDAAGHFLDMGELLPSTLYALATRDGMDYFSGDDVNRYPSAVEWKAAKKSKSSKEQ